MSQKEIDDKMLKFAKDFNKFQSNNIRYLEAFLTNRNDREVRLNCLKLIVSNGIYYLDYAFDPNCVNKDYVGMIQQYLYCFDDIVKELRFTPEEIWQFLKGEKTLYSQWKIAVMNYLNKIYDGELIH